MEDLCEEKRRILESRHESRADTDRDKTTNKMAEGHFGRDKNGKVLVCDSCFSGTLSLSAPEMLVRLIEQNCESIYICFEVSTGKL